MPFGIGAIAEYPIAADGTIFPSGPSPGGTNPPGLAFSAELPVVTVAAWDSPAGQNWSGAGYMSKYEIDSSIWISGTFLNPVVGLYVDPTVVTLLVMDPTGAAVTYTYPANITKDTLGHYHMQITPTKSGTWTYKWQATGNAAATSPDTTFTVNPSSLIAG